MINRVSFFILSLVLSLTISLSQAQTSGIDSLRQKAEQGDAEAQLLHGYGYYHGIGVPQDHTEAVKWYRRAAEQENARAQYSLGHAYHDGKGVLQDYVLAHMWFNLAASKSKGSVREAAADLRAIVAEKMTREERSEAQRLAREWAEKHRK